MFGLFHRERGQALGLVLAVAALGLLAAFTAAGVATANLRIASKISNVAIAEALAESVVQEALAHLQEDIAFQSDIVLDDIPGLPEGSRATLTFDRSLSGLYSTNNYTGDQGQGWGRELPAQSIHLVGAGEAGGVTRHVEVVAHLPAFPVALACDGPVTVSNSTIGSVDSPEDLRYGSDGRWEVEEDDLKPGHLITNSQSANACVLDRVTLVKGDVQARGTVKPNGAIIEGEVRSPYSGLAPIPKFNLRDYDPKTNDNTHYEALTGTFGSLDLVGNVRYQGNLLLSGDLNLDNAYLFVDGDINVRGAVQGVGAVISTGKATFEGAVALSSSKQIAVLTSNGIKLTGSGSGQSIFHGLLYTKGDFEARSITILGGFITDGADRAPGAPEPTATLVDCNVVNSSVSITPGMHREVFAVVRRFQIPSPLNVDLLQDPTGFPTGRWQTRDVANVIDRGDPDFDQSHWSLNDPAVLRVRWVNNEPQYRYEWWGEDSGTSPPTPVFAYIPGSGWANDKEAFIDSVADMQSSNSHEDVRRHLASNNPEPNDPPARQAYADYLRAVLEHLTTAPPDRVQVNFVIDPRLFLNLGDKIRIQLHRTF